MISLGLGILLLQVERANYEPGQHISLISTRLKEAQEVARRADDQKITSTEAANQIGKLLGENRRNQAHLTTFVQSARRDQSAIALRTIQLSGLFDAYLASTLLGLDGDSQAKELSVLLGARLSRQLSRTS
ncbi:MAG: hypothetical protein MUC92_04880 [Fimbriimonadaceae bacterium]|jgi:hypothetical protein|nr:hypothetical protein [Fimbriimonadaceae bacterium]